MLTILLVWLIQFVVLASTGFIAKAILERVFKESFKLNLLHEIILGLCSLSLILSFLTLEVKISFWVFLSWFFLSCIVFVINRKRFIGQIGHALKYLSGGSSYVFLLFIAFYLFCLIYSAGEVRIFDTGLYHAQAIRWINEYGVVPGLGNLHSRFAFNSHFFIVQAFFNFSFFSDREFVVYGVNSFFFLLIGFTLLKKLEDAETTGEVLFFFFILLAASLVVLPRIQSPSPDIISFLFIIHLMLTYYETNFRYHAESKFIYVYIIIVICYLVTVKLSNLPLLLFGLVAYRMLSVKYFFRFTLICSLFLVPFFIRNYFLSGYLIYPFPSVDLFQPDWKISVEKCYLEINSIKAWAIAPEANPANVLALPLVEKTKLWFSLLDVFSKIIVAINLLLPLLILKKVNSRTYNQLVFWIVVLINQLYWFLSAPDPRFGFGILTFSFAYLLSGLPFFRESERIKRFIKPVTAIALTAVLCSYAIFKWDYARHTLSQNLVRPEPLKTITYETSNGIKITNEADGRCFYTKLPCACGKNDEITFRTDKIADGFKIKK